MDAAPMCEQEYAYYPFILTPVLPAEVTERHSQILCV